MLRLALALLFLAAPAAAQVRVSVVDGDTLRWGTRLVRIAGLDAPELRGARCPAERQRAERARDRLAQLVARGAHITPVRGRDRYGRLLATVHTPAGADVSAVLIGERLAVPYAGRGPRADWCRPGDPLR